MPADPTVEVQSLTRTCNEALILAALRASPKHGYQLALEVEARGGGGFRLQHGTLYPILHRLEKRGLIDGTWSQADSARRRKLYTLTAEGRRYAARQLEAWRCFVDRFVAATEDSEA